jgi:YspA, cpYpsA-related SLOG family
MNLIVAGSRNFNDYELLKKSILEFIKELGFNTYQIVIVSGGANGADKLGERFASEYYGMTVKRYLPDWNKFGKSAGYKRNELMAQNADACICFWDGESKGTNHMINLANQYELKLKVIKYEK